MFRTGLAILVSAGLMGVVFADQQKSNSKLSEAVAKELETFAATWEIVSVKPEGAIKGATRLVFHPDGTYAAVDENDKELWAGTFEINPLASPKVWDHRSHDNKKKKVDVLGVYKLDGDKLTACCVVGEWKGKKWMGKARPKAVKLEGADVLLELRRVQPLVK